MEEITGPIEAVVIDTTHLELKTPLPRKAGQRILVHLVPLHESAQASLRELEAAYRAWSERDRQTEIALTEEGVWGQLPIEEAFPDEGEWPWWE